jgi:hypothetical protein
MRMKKNGTSRNVFVEFHAGYKGEEEPRKVLRSGNEWIVEKIIERKRISDHKTGRSYEEFTCMVDNKLAKLSVHSNGQHYLTFLKD